MLTDEELYAWALARYGSHELARKLAIVGQLHADEHMGDDPATIIYLPDSGPGL